MASNGASARGLRQVGYFDCPGGGQVVVDGRVAYIAHMKGPDGTTLVDVSDPKSPRRLAGIEVPPGTHSHKVRAANGLMLVNREAHPAHKPEAGVTGGLGIHDVSDPTRPREITFWRSGGAGVHRFTFDGRYAYISPEMDGYVGNIVMILDLADPAKPREVGRWWMPGQWTAGGETPSWPGRHHRCHHPIRSGDRLYVSYWHGGFVILDIADMSKPTFVSGLDWSPPFITPTHTAIPVPFPLRGRRVLLVADEDVAKLEPGPPSFLWLVDISDERRPVPFASFQVDGRGRHAPARVHRLPSAHRDDHGDGGSRGLVRLRPAHRRHRRPARAARGGALPSRRAPGMLARVEQRRLRRRPRTDLPDRPGTRPQHPRARLRRLSLQIRPGR